MKLLVVITRMWPAPGTGDDEFVQLWSGQAGWKGASPVLDRTVGRCRLLILHGCCQDDEGNRFRKPSEAETAEAIWSQVEDLAQDLEHHPQVGVLFHPPSGRMTLTDALRARIADSRAVGEVAFIADYGGRIVEDSNSALGQLAEKVRAGVHGDQAPGPELARAYEAVWRRYEGNQSLEDVLSILHKCLSPHGANDMLEAYRANTVDMSRNAAQLLAPLKRATDPLSEAYIDTLSALRDIMLSPVSETGEEPECVCIDQ